MAKMNTTSHEAILSIKLQRLAKFSGSILTKKTRQYKKAVQVYRQKHPIPVTIKAESNGQSWLIELSSGSFTVRATSEEKARKAAREMLKISRLPVGTKISKA